MCCLFCVTHFENLLLKALYKIKIIIIIIINLIETHFCFVTKPNLLCVSLLTCVNLDHNCILSMAFSWNPCILWIMVSRHRPLSCVSHHPTIPSITSLSLPHPPIWDCTNLQRDYTIGSKINTLSTACAPGKTWSVPFFFWSNPPVQTEPH